MITSMVSRNRCIPLTKLLLSKIYLHSFHPKKDKKCSRRCNNKRVSNLNAIISLNRNRRPILNSKAAWLAPLNPILRVYSKEIKQLNPMHPENKPSLYFLVATNSHNKQSTMKTSDILFILNILSMHLVHLLYFKIQ